MANLSDCRSESRFSCGSAGTGKETVCIETNRILDSCRDRDCFENTRVYLTDMGNDIIERTSTVRTKEATIAWTYINIDPVRFNRGFYTVTIRFFIKLIFEACLGPGRSQDFDGIAVVEKKVILYGGESNVCVFRSSPCSDNFCNLPEPCCGTKNVPEAVVEVVDPIVLSTGIYEKASCGCGCCCCGCSDIPETIVSGLNGCLCDNEEGDRYLLVSLGVFSVVRIVRPAQYLVNATEYCVPDKECVAPDEDDPCRLFNSMAFPISEFCPPDYIHSGKVGHDKHCGCQ